MKWALDALAFAPVLDTSLPSEPAMAVIIRPVDSPTGLMAKAQPDPARLRLQAAPGPGPGIVARQAAAMAEIGAGLSLRRDTK
jgi:hypothetical protein